MSCLVCVGVVGFQFPKNIQISLCKTQMAEFDLFQAEDVEFEKYSHQISKFQLLNVTSEGCTNGMVRSSVLSGMTVPYASPTLDLHKGVANLRHSVAPKTVRFTIPYMTGF
jgi:hypothetical protein